MATTPNPSSAYAGYLTPGATPATKYGAALEDVFHDTIQGILGFTDGSLIRPRWQADPPDQPPFNVSWVAFGIADRKGDWQPFQQHDPAALDGFGANTLERDEQLIVLHSFYGPNAESMQSMYEDGLLIDQNRALLEANGIKLMSMNDAYKVPALLKHKWVTKVDQRITFRRHLRREYPILTLTGADGTLDNEHYLTDLTVSPPAP